MLKSNVLYTLLADQKSAYYELQRAYGKINVAILLPTIVVVGSIVYFNMTWWDSIIFSFFIYNTCYVIFNKYIINPAKEAEQLAAKAYIDYINNEIANSQATLENSN
jgi:hypothetical protein